MLGHRLVTVLWSSSTRTRLTEPCFGSTTRQFLAQVRSVFHTLSNNKTNVITQGCRLVRYIEVRCWYKQFQSKFKSICPLFLQVINLIRKFKVKDDRFVVVSCSRNDLNLTTPDLVEFISTREYHWMVSGWCGWNWFLAAKKIYNLTMLHLVESTTLWMQNCFQSPRISFANKDKIKELLSKQCL